VKKKCSVLSATGGDGATDDDATRCTEYILYFLLINNNHISTLTFGGNNSRMATSNINNINNDNEQ